MPSGADNLEHLWPDSDRRDDALLRVAESVYPEPSLTPAEHRCLQAAAAGLRWRETAFVYGIAPETVTKQLANARRKLRAKNTTHAVAIALRRHLIL